MKHFLKQKKLEFYLLIGILILGAFLRFYNYPYRYSFGEETIRDAVIGIEGARELQFPLTGSFSSLGPFTFGPWYAYQLIIFHLIAPFTYSPWIYLGIISVLYIFVMYKIGKILGGSHFGIILAFLSAVSPAQIISATHLTSHNNTNIFAVLAIWLFLKILLKKVSYWWGFVLGLIIGIGMNLHFQMSGLLVLPLIILVYKRKNYLYFITAACGVIASFIPLLIFELNNHWFTTRNIFSYLMYGRNAVYVPNRWLFYLRDFWPSFWGDALGIPVWMAQILIALFLTVFSYLAWKRKINKATISLGFAFLFNFILLRYYWGPRFFGYLNFIRPFVFIFTTFTILHLATFYKSIIYKYGIYFVFLAIIVGMSFQRVYLGLEKDPFTTRFRESAVSLQKRFPGKKFVLYTCSKTYKSTYNSDAFSLLFLLDGEGLYDEKHGMKIGLQSDCFYGKKAELGEIADVDYLSTAELAAKGWTPISFKSLYDSYARWWFKMQP